MDKTRARELRKNMTKAELTLWKHLRLRQLGGYKFRRQQPIGKYIVDFVCLEKRLIIEIDGGQHSEQIAYDLERSSWLEAQGFRMLRFWNNQVLTETEVVKEVIAEALGCYSHTPPPNLPPQGGEGKKGADLLSQVGEEKILLPSPSRGEGMGGGRKLDGDNDELLEKADIGDFKMLKAIIYGFILVWQMLTLSSAYAWKLPIEVSTVAENGEKVYNKLVVGIESDATDGFDNLWDTPAILSHPDPDSPLALRAYLTPPPSPSPSRGEGMGGGDLLSQGGEEGQGGGGEAEMGRLWKDIRGPTKGDTTWEIAVDSVPRGGTVVINWEAPQGFLKKGERVVLRDNNSTGTDGVPVQTDITQASSYIFVSSGEEPRSLYLTLSKESVEPHRSGGGSGFGCGTIRPDNDGPANGGEGAFSIVVLFSPLIFIRLLRGLYPSQ